MRFHLICEQKSLRFSVYWLLFCESWLSRSRCLFWLAQIGSFITNLGLSVSSGSYCTSANVGSGTTVTHLLPHLLSNPLCVQLDGQHSEPEYWLCFSVGYYSMWFWIRTSILSCGAITQEICRPIIFSLYNGVEICETCSLNRSIVFTEEFNWENGGPTELIQNFPSHTDILGCF